MLLDFQACTNAVWDRKPVCASEYHALEQGLAAARVGVWIAEYLARIGELEGGRPPSGGDHRTFDAVRSYREAVARLSLATLAGITLDEECFEDAISSTYCDSDVATLVQMAMQCQIIDDVLDYRADLLAGLPSFLTASASLPQAMALTANATRLYAANRSRSSGRGLFPLEAALYVLSGIAKLVVAVAHTRESRYAAAAR